MNYPLFILFSIIALVSYKQHKELWDISNWKCRNQTLPICYTAMAIPTNENHRNQFRDFFITRETQGEVIYILNERDASKSFNVDNYWVDSYPEFDMFWILLKDNRFSKVWFIGMLTAGQTDFKINYIDPESNKVRSYYPDFFVQKNDGTYLIIEAKGDRMIDNAVSKAKKTTLNRWPPQVPWITS